MSELLDRLLRPEIENVQKHLPEARYKVKRLSKACGEDVVFTLKALPYGRVEELRDSNSEDLGIHILLAGVTEPDLKSAKLREKFGGETPGEVVKALLLPGEIEEISRAIEKLCGYRVNTIEEVKNA